MKGTSRSLLHAGAGAAVIAVALHYAWVYLTPFLIATLLAAMIDPLVNRLQRSARMGRGAAVTLVLSVFLCLLLAVLGAVVANLSADLERLLADLPAFAGRLSTLLETARDRMDLWLRGLPHPLNEALPLGVEQVAQGASAAARGLLGALRGAPHFLFLVLVAGVATYFISRDRRVLWRAVLEVLPRPWRPQVVRLRDEIFGGVLGLLRAQLCLVAVTAVATVTGLLLCDVPYSWLLGLAAAVLDLVPMIGPGGVLGPVALVYLVQGDLATAAAVTAVWLAIVLARQWLEPHVLGTHLGVHPLPMLMAVYAAVQVAGAAGFLLGPLALVVVKAFLVVAVWPPAARR